MANSFGNYSLADIAAQVMERDARFGARGSVPLLGQDEFTRYWKVDAHLSERVREFLDLYGDGDHFIAGSPSVETHAIENPSADQGVSVSGLWRVVRNAESAEQPGIVLQTLRRGFLRPPSVSDTSWSAPLGADSEGRIFRVQQVAPDVQIAFGTHYVVIYPGVDKTYLREFSEELIARGTLVNPKFDKQTPLVGSYTFRSVRNQENEDGSHTVMAVLCSTDVPEGLKILIYDGCAAKEWITFFYDLPSVPTVPASTSGVQYRLQNVSLDRETGLWSCVLAQDETKTLTIGKHTAAQDLFTKHERSVWQGVRAGDVDHLGNPVPLEAPGIATDGAVVDISRSKNRDCTQNIGQDRTHELPVAAAQRSETKSLFEHSIDETDRAQAADTDVTVPEASGGVVVSKQVGKTRSNKRDISTRTRTERPVTAAQKSATRTLFQVRLSQVDKSQPLTTSLEAPDPAGGVVVSKRGAKTPGNLLDVTTDTDTERPVTAAQKSATRTLFQVRLSQVDKSQPLATSLDAPEPAGGVVVSKRGAKTPGNLLDVTTDTDAERPVTAAQKSATRTLFQVRLSQVDKSQPLTTSLEAPEPAGGVVVSKRGAKTPGNLLDVTTDTDTEQAVTAAQKSATRTIFESRISQVDRSQPLSTPLVVPAATGGKVVSKRGTKTPGNLLDVTTDENQELAVLTSDRTFRKRAYSTQTRVVNRHMSAVPADPETPGHVLSSSKTAGGLYNVTTDEPSTTPFLHEYTVPGYTGPIQVREFGYYTTSEFQALLASLGSASDWSISARYDEEIDRWSGRIVPKRLRIRTRKYWEEFYKAGIIEVETSLEHRGNKVWKVETQFTYTLCAENDVDDLINMYKAESARKNGSWIRPDYGNNRGTYKAVTDIRITSVTDVTDLFYDTGMVTL